MGNLSRIVPTSVRPLARRVRRWVLEKLSKSKDFSVLSGEEDVLKCLISYNEYGGYCVPESSRHRPATQKILSNKVHEPRTIEFIRANCRDGDIVHAGAYFGDFLPALSTRCSDGSKIWAFEPNSENFRCAKKTLEINGIVNVELMRAGLGAERGSSRIKVTDNKGRALGGGSRITLNLESNSQGSEPIDIVTVDEVVGVRRSVSIVQLDVEGHEKEALMGALETIRRCRPILILEVWPKSKLLESDWFSENIMSLGYRRSVDLHRNVVFVC